MMLFAVFADEPSADAAAAVFERRYDYFIVYHAANIIYYFSAARCRRFSSLPARRRLPPIRRLLPPLITPLDFAFAFAAAVCRLFVFASFSRRH